MIHYLLLPMLLLLLVIVQITILELFSFGWIGIEISSSSSSISDSISTPSAGTPFPSARFLFGLSDQRDFRALHVSVCPHFLSLQHRGRKNLRRETGPDRILYGTLHASGRPGDRSLYRFVFGADILDAIPKIFVPQAVVVGCLSPLCFILLQRFEVFLHVEDRRPARRI